MQTKPRIWALIVGIKYYSNKAWSSADGAEDDVRNVCDFLANSLKIPDDYILRLVNGQATRREIISAFKKHLIENPRIQSGDAILFHFSGHGSYLKAPANWAVVEAKTGDDNFDNMVEVILPHDEGVGSPPACGIPDRTLAALIDQAAARHGSNITVVLDCCSSGHGTRSMGAMLLDGKKLARRDIEPSLLVPLPHDLDHSLLSTTTHGHLTSLSERPIAKRVGRFRALSGGNHVLLAACKPRERAFGADAIGGILTNLWISAMKSSNLRPRTYAAAINFITLQLEIWQSASGNSRWSQHPQCEGVSRDRLIFEETTIRTDQYLATENGGVFTVHGGEIHGLKQGMTIEIYALDEHLKGTRLGETKTEQVAATTCVASLTHTHMNWMVAYTATIIDSPQLRYTVDFGPSEKFSNKVTSALFQQFSTLSETIVRVDDEDQADLKVILGPADFDGSLSSIMFERLDPLLRDLPNPPAKLSAQEIKIADFTKIFRGIARFNWLLPLTNSTHPFAEHVEFAIAHLLKPIHGDNQQGGFILRALGDLAETSDLGLRVKEDDEYAIILHNKSDVDLYVQVLCFDPDVYSIEPLYEPSNVAEATLPAGDTLQIGASTEAALPLTFFVPENGTRATLFAKVFLSTEAIKTGALCQEAVIGPEAYGNRAPLPSKEGSPTGRWDTILQPITVEK